MLCSYLRLQQQQLKVRDCFLVNSQKLHFAGECVSKLSDLKLKEARPTTFNEVYHITFQITSNCNLQLISSKYSK